MEKNKKEYNVLLDGILKDIDVQAEAVIQEAEKSYTERLNSVNRQIERINKEAEKNISNQKEQIQKNNLSNISIEKRRLDLKNKEELIEEIIEKVKVKLEASIKNKDYKKTLLGWIIEAAVGLNCTEAIIECSFKEDSLIDDKLIKDAEKEIKEITSYDVKLSKSDKTLISQGIVLKSIDGRTAFNNQLNTRLLRYQSEIRNMIYKDLFSNYQDVEK